MNGTPISTIGRAHGRNRCKISLQGMPSRTLVTHRIARAIQPRTRARSSADSRPVSSTPIATIPAGFGRFWSKSYGAQGPGDISQRNAIFLANIRLTIAVS